MMDTRHTACMINGDVILRAGRLQTIRLHEDDDKPSQFMKYETSISTVERVVLTGEHDPSLDVLVEVWIPLRMVYDKPKSVIGNVQGRLYIPNPDQDIELSRVADEVENLNPESNSLQVKPLIEVVQFRRRYPFTEKTEKLEEVFVYPTIFVIAKVVGKSRTHDVFPQWRVFDGQSSSFIRGSYEEMTIRFLLRGQMASWKPTPGSSILMLAKFAIPRNDSPALQVTYVNILCDADSAATSSPAATLTNGLLPRAQQPHTHSLDDTVLANEGGSLTGSSLKKDLKTGSDVFVNVYTSDSGFGAECKRAKMMPDVKMGDVDPGNLKEQKLDPVNIFVNIRSG